MSIDQRNATGELSDFGKKLSRALIDHGRDVPEAIALGNRHMAGQQDEHAGARFTGLEQLFAVLVTLDLAEPAHPRDLVRRQRRKRLLMTRKRAGRRSAR